MRSQGNEFASSGDAHSTDMGYSNEGLSDDGDIDLRSTGVGRSGNNVLNSLKEDSETFCALKFLLGALFILTGIGITAATFAVSSNAEIANFESKFRLYASNVADLTLSNTRLTFGKMELLGSEITSNALSANVEWPFVEMEYFGDSVVTLMNITLADFVGFSPIVSRESRKAWEDYVKESRDQLDPLQESLYNFDGVISYDDTGPFVPWWQIAPENEVTSIANFDFRTFQSFDRGLTTILRNENISALSEPIDPLVLKNFPGLNTHLSHMEPHCFLVHPIFENFNGNKQIVGTLVGMLKLEHLFTETVDKQAPPMAAVLRDSCGSNYTFSLNGPDIVYEGQGDLHDVAFNELVDSTPFTRMLYDYNVSFECEYTLDIYPSRSFQNNFVTNQPWILTGSVIGIFIFIGIPLLLYSRMIKRRQDFLVDEAVRTTNILTSLFPSNVHNRLFGRAGQVGGSKDIAHHLHDGVDNAMKSHHDAHNDHNGEEIVDGMYKTKPIADLFPNTTIMFADMVGFTAWSSEREPAHVFTLLETIFGAFDSIAKRMDVFKVETIGDCYVAVAGLPHARNDHAVVMAMFAKECMVKVTFLVGHMEMTLGPETGDLSMRFGLHSGPVTAGVLRGEKSRFQLFGDSVNTAARIETTGERGKIHMSHETAELLISAGHSKWVVPRRDLVTAKGKGVMRTYWLVQSNEGAKSQSDDESGDEDGDEFDADDQSSVHTTTTTQSRKQNDNWGLAGIGTKSSHRLVEWNVDVLYQLLKKVVEKRFTEDAKVESAPSQEPLISLRPEPSLRLGGLGISRREEQKPKVVALDPRIKSQLREYVSLIASMYRDHPFHNFEHASHVMLSITKLFSRITTSTTTSGMTKSTEDTQAQLHRTTFGISSDPLLQFAVAFAALIHDVDHAGVPNSQLVKEDINLAKKYRYKSVAEKHSIRLAWERMMDSDYKELRNCLCPTQVELKRFRNFVVNTVMATDIVDKELNEKRRDRWRQCFDESIDTASEEDMNRKATIVVEHLIQASDVAHTMQHFEVYKKWNERLFCEVYSAFDSGRAEGDPSEQWYQGEIGFFDFYIIPLAQKLEACGVFGATSHEYLNFAQENRSKWEKEGQQNVEIWLKRYHESKGKKIAKK